MESLTDWLIEQAPVIFVMGVGLYVLYKLYVDEKEKNSNLRLEYEGEKKDLVNSLIELTTKVTEVTSIVVDRIESNSDNNNTHYTTISEKLDDIRNTLSSLEESNNG